jgi:hypothetical protein
VPITKVVFDLTSAVRKERDRSMRSVWRERTTVGQKMENIYREERITEKKKEEEHIKFGNMYREETEKNHGTSWSTCHF